MKRLFAFIAILLTACAAPATPTGTPAPSATPSLAPSATLAPTLTPTNTATPTFTPPPTSTFTPTPTPATINPLTGLVLDDPALLNRRPLAIKVAHFPRRVREHQAGLSLADNVWEHYAEGGVIRFTAIFFSHSPEKVGNVRSARLIDAHLGQAYQAMLVASGSSTGTMNRIRENEALYARVIAEATGYSGCPLLCREESAALTTDKLFTSPAALWQLADDLHLNGKQDLSGYAFDPAPPSNAAPLTTIHLDYQLNNTVAEYRYDSDTGRYARWIDTAQLPELAPHVDTLTGEQLTTANVMVLYVPHVSSNIREAEGGQKYFSYDILLTGSGPAILFRDGEMVEGMWERASAMSGLPRFVGADGKPLAFKPGNIWFDVLSTDSPTQVNGAVFQARFKAPQPFPATATPAP